VPLLRRRPPPWDATADDEELAARAQGGDRAAFGALYDRHLPRVHGYCRRLLGGARGGRGRHHGGLHAGPGRAPAYRAGAFRPWLFAIAHNVVATELRRRRPTVPLAEAAGVADRGPSPEELAAAAAERSAVLALLPRLSADQQHVVALRLAGLSAAEIGAALGKPRNAVDGLQHRALLRLRALVAVGGAPAKGGG
jgi:RNA polymerase sigma-70 factor (ECF subfamily)